jgi:hypothetical protein
MPDLLPSVPSPPFLPPPNTQGRHLSLSLALESIVVILVPTITWYMLLRDRFPRPPRPLIPRRQAPALRIIPVPVQSRWRGPHDLAPRTEYQTYFLGQSGTILCQGLPAMVQTTLPPP